MERMCERGLNHLLICLLSALSCMLSSLHSFSNLMICSDHENEREKICCDTVSVLTVTADKEGTDSFVMLIGSWC